MTITNDEKQFVKGYATALQDIMKSLTGKNSNRKSFDPVEFKDDVLKSFAFDLKDGYVHHDLSDYDNVDEIKQLMLDEATIWCLNSRALKSTINSHEEK